MPTNSRISNLAANAAADAIARLLDNGYLRIYSGTQPADVDTAIAGQVLLAELRFAATSAPAAAAGVLTWNTLTADSSADNTGIAAWYRGFKADGVSAVKDGSVGLSGSNLNLNSIAISAGAAVSIGSFTYTQSKVGP